MPRNKDNYYMYKGQEQYEVMCPHCDYKNSIDVADWQCNDGDEEEETCANCGKEFAIYVSVNVYFESDYK